MAKKVASTKQMPREQWLELRRNSIGGSDAAAACGQSPWTSPLALWCDKMGMIPDRERGSVLNLKDLIIARAFFILR